MKHKNQLYHHIIVKPDVWKTTVNVSAHTSLNGCFSMSYLSNTSWADQSTCRVHSNVHSWCLWWKRHSRPRHVWPHTDRLYDKCAASGEMWADIWRLVIERMCGSLYFSVQLGSACISKINSFFNLPAYAFRWWLFLIFSVIHSSRVILLWAAW